MAPPITHYQTRAVFLVLQLQELLSDRFAASLSYSVLYSFSSAKERASQQPERCLQTINLPLQVLSHPSEAIWQANQSSMQSIGQNSYRPVSSAPAHPGTESAWTTVAMPSPTMSHGTGVSTHSPIYIGHQLRAQVQPQIQSQQVPVTKPVMTEFGTNPPVRGMPPELPECIGYFENTV